MSVFDLSKYQPVDRIAELDAGGKCDGVIVKLGERNMDTGELELDPKFCDHVNEAVAHNKPYGIYLMSRPTSTTEAQEEAQWINDMVAEYLNGQEPTLGTWFDLERPETKRDGIYDDVMYAIGLLKDWWKSNHIGIYASYYYFYDYLDLKDMKQKQVPVWLAQYNGHNGLTEDGYPYEVLWQFTTNENYQDENEWCGFKD